MLDKYEELNLTHYVDGDTKKMVFGAQLSEEQLVSKADSIKDQVEKLCDNLKNPFFNIFHWVKGELFDIEAVVAALNRKDAIQSNIGKQEKKKKSTQGDLDNVTTGKKTLKTLMKSEKDAGDMVSKIENVRVKISFFYLFLISLYFQTDKEIENNQFLYDIITIYLGETIITPFKSKKITIYNKII